MEWEKRITEAKYTSPSGKGISFLYGSVSRETELKTGVFTFPDKDGAKVQHQGMGAMSFPLSCVFNGSDCMEKADKFEAMLFERGIGELQHPVYGVHKVVPHGKIKRVDDLISGLNESVVEITFVKIIADDFLPALEAVQSAEIEKKYEAFADGACEDFAGGVVTESIHDELRQKSILNTQTENIKGGLESLVKSKKEAFSDFVSTVTELKGQVNAFFDKADGKMSGALNTARLVLNTMRIPSRVMIGVSEKIKGYSALIFTLAGQFINDPFGVCNVVNSVMNSRLFLQGALASLASGVALQLASQAAEEGQDSGAPVCSRDEALNAALVIIDLFEMIKDFDDKKVSSNSFVDTNTDAYFLLYDLVQKSIRFILNSAFNLPMQRTVVLDRDRQVIELSAELYGSVDYVDSIIFDNKLTADEIVVLPQGREITYYVKSA